MKSEIPNDLDECRRVIERLFAALEEKDSRIDDLMQQVQLLLRARYGRKAETVNLDQLRLFAAQDEEGQVEEQPEAVAVERAPEGNKGRHGRRKPAAELPRIRVKHVLSEVELVCPECGDNREKIGEEVSEQYDYVPASVTVVEHVRCKYACRKCQGHVVVADGAEKPVERGLAAPGMLAHVATSKFADHLPLHRQEGIFKRQGASISRSTLCDWVAATASILAPVYERMKARVLDSRIIWTDDTPVKLQDREHDKNMREARIWVYIGDEQNRYTVYDFTDSRKRDGPQKFLGKYSGYLQADAFAGYDCIYATGSVREVACMAHARRKFFDSLGSSQKAAEEALLMIRNLYDIERATAGAPPDNRRAVRQEKSRVILERFKKWLDNQHLCALPKSPIGKAINYALNNWQALCVFLEDGELTIDNNRAENGMRSIAVGRKNWLFTGSRKGGRNAAILSSLVATCKQHNVNPQAYLTDVITRLSRKDADALDLDQLLPDTWATSTA
jgi:transposase